MRTLHINSKEAWKHEAKAIELAKKVMTDENLKKQYKTAERLFIIQPLMRSERLEDCNLAADLLQTEVNVAIAAGNKELKKRSNQMLKIVNDMTNMVEQFGRLPYGNNALGRKSTPEELEFIQMNE